MKSFRILGCAIPLFIAACGQQSSTTNSGSASDKPISTATVDRQVAPQTESKTPPIQPSLVEDEPVEQPTHTAVPLSTVGLPKPVEPTPVQATPIEVAPPIAAKVEPDVLIDIDPDKPHPIDLTKYYRIREATFFRFGRGWKKAPRGSVTLANVPLKIEGMICLWGSRSAADGGNSPKSVEGIPIGWQFDALYIYHHTSYSSPDGTPVVNIVFHYDDKSSSTFEILYGNHVRDWWKKINESDEILDSNSKKVFRGLNPQAGPDQPDHIQSFISEIMNPEPSKSVMTIDLVSAEKQSSANILAITTGPTGLLQSDLNVIEAVVE